ncbi:hypothetical protein CDAR_585441 [Caerostris darwini]|uniref:Uncharacterized protein n=1 Tax=Caerostris darwini TaxID=1538125 RepID=A0AAV4WZY6_9ARAC|nr:hypothetical protein CDAR_585441 [Caerostris darwini]
MVFLDNPYLPLLHHILGSGLDEMSLCFVRSSPKQTHRSNVPCMDRLPTPCRFMLDFLIKTRAEDEHLLSDILRRTPTPQERSSVIFLLCEPYIAVVTAPRLSIHVPVSLTASAVILPQPNVFFFQPVLFNCQKDSDDVQSQFVRSFSISK